RVRYIWAAVASVVSVTLVSTVDLLSRRPGSCPGAFPSLGGLCGGRPAGGSVVGVGVGSVSRSGHQSPSGGAVTTSRAAESATHDQSSGLTPHPPDCGPAGRWRWGRGGRQSATARPTR